MGIGNLRLDVLAGLAVLGAGGAVKPPANTAVGLKSTVESDRSNRGPDASRRAQPEDRLRVLQSRVRNALRSLGTPAHRG